VENHVHRPPRLGSRRSLNLRIGIRCTVYAPMLSQINGLAMLIWGCPNIVNCTVACP